MLEERNEDSCDETHNNEEYIEKVSFISIDEDEQEGNFEFLCCRGGYGGPGRGGRW